MTDPLRDLGGHDPYRLLGVPVTATRAEIVAAYRRQVRLVHPDRPDGDEHETVLLHLARDVLLDEDLRARYDGRSAEPPAGRRGSWNDAGRDRPDTADDLGDPDDLDDPDDPWESWDDAPDPGPTPSSAWDAPDVRPGAHAAAARTPDPTADRRDHRDAWDDEPYAPGSWDDRPYAPAADPWTGEHVPDPWAGRPYTPGPAPWQGPYPPAGYRDPGPGAADPTRVHWLTVAGLVLSCTCYLSPFGLFLSVRRRRAPLGPVDRTVALVGIVLGSIFSFFWLLSFIS